MIRIIKQIEEYRLTASENLSRDFLSEASLEDDGADDDDDDDESKAGERNHSGNTGDKGRLSISSSSPTEDGPDLAALSAEIDDIIRQHMNSPQL